MTGFMQDMRCAARNLLRAPAFAAAAVVTLAIGIGGTTAMFSLLDRAVLRPLPVSAPDRLVFLYWNGPWMNGANTGWAKWSYPWYEDLRDRSEIFEELFCRYSTEASFGYGGEARRVKLEMVSGNYFDALGLEASLGRAIAREDDRIPNGHPVAVLGHGFWREHFDSDPGAVGREIRLNGRVFEVIGIAPRDFRGVEFGNPAQVFAPMAMKAALSPGWMAMYDLGNRRNRWVNVMGRLKAGVSLDEARAAIEPLFRSLVEYDLAQPELARLGEPGRGRYRRVRIEVRPAAQGLWQGRENAAAALTTLLAMVALLLLIGCANVANILMARGAARSKETAVRMALGAGRFRLAAQLMAESLLPALLAGLSALAVSTWLLAFLGWFLDESVFQHLVSTSPDLRIVFFTLAVSLLTAVLCGLTPALQSARAGVFAALKEQSGTVGGGLRLRKAFVAFQVFLSVVLIVGAGLFLRTLYPLQPRRLEQLRDFVRLAPREPFQVRRDDLAQLRLLRNERVGRVDPADVELLAERLILIHDPALEDAERFEDVLAQPHVEAGLVVLDRLPRRRDPRDRFLQGHVEIERQRRRHRERVQIAHPAAVDAARRIPGEGGVDVAVGQDDHAGLQRRQDLLVGPRGEVGGVDQAEAHRRQQSPPLPAPRRAAHDRGRVPSREDGDVALGPQPFVQQVQLRALARAVDPLDDDQLAGQFRMVDIRRMGHPVAGVLRHAAIIAVRAAHRGCGWLMSGRNRRGRWWR